MKFFILIFFIFISVMSGVTQAQVGAGSTTGTTGSNLDYIPGSSTGGQSGKATGSQSAKPIKDESTKKETSTGSSVLESGKSNSKKK